MSNYISLKEEIALKKSPWTKILQERAHMMASLVEKDFKMFCDMKYRSKNFKIIQSSQFCTLQTTKQKA